MPKVKTERRRLHVNGIVQGVGFRPFVYRLAKQYQLTGFVCNSASGVEIEVEGPADRLPDFIHDLKTKAPPLASYSAVTAESVATVGDPLFVIRASDAHGKVATLIPPDIAVCEDCLAELFDPTDRRYRYPFANCTNCGPRYTIIENIPYDRPFTSMRHFAMCDDCRSEYHDPADRRFHAQPNACPVCGPHVTLFDADQTVIAEKEEAIDRTIALLGQGDIVAIKGLGGFHLAVDATNSKAVQRLRERKGREEKPLAVMVRDQETAQRYCAFDAASLAALTSPQSPIVLAPKKHPHALADTVAPGTDRFGVMLPYTPLHHLLFDSDLTALVMTSANYSEEPICIGNDEAFSRLGEIADYFLLHNRDIYLRSDDSVVWSMGGRMRTIRQSRGYVPRPITLAADGPPVLGVGAELKNTICLLKDQQALVSQHVGDLKNLEAYDFFKKTIDHLVRIFEVEPELAVHDLHPVYLSTRWAEEQNKLPVLAVQHHHAHLAACLAENGAEGPAIGLILDGTGYGTDGTIWGGEVLVGDLLRFERYGHFEPMPLPGGDAAVEAPWRTAVAYLHEAYDGELPDLPFLAMHDIGPIVEMAAKRFNSPLTSSCGRLFDAVAALSGGRQTIRYEAQAAIEFMQACQDLDNKPFPFEIENGKNGLILSVRAIIRAAAEAVRGGASFAEISARFHRTLIDLFLKVALRASRETGIKTVALSGGVFQNRLLFEGVLPVLKENGMEVLTHAELPTNDGCMSFGQAVIGRKHLLKG